MDSEIMNEQLLDAAISDALESSTAAESSAYQRQLASTGADARQMDREIRETAARLGAASPHLPPPSELRGRILQATAPGSFRMEEYRKVMKDNGRFYRWGFAAAMVFLMAGAYYNLSIQTTLKQVTSQANAMLSDRDAVLKDRNSLLTEVLSPGTVQVSLTGNTGQVAAKVFIDPPTQRAILVVPQGSIPKGQSLAFTADLGNGNKLQYATTVVEAPANLFSSQPSGQLSPNIVAQDVQPVKQQQMFSASMH